MPGGAANKVGNRYERLWTVLALLGVLAGDAEYLQIEVPGDIGRGAEFLLMRGGTPEWHQVKRQTNRGSWTIQNLQTAGVLAPWWPKLQNADRCVFVSTTSAQELTELAQRASDAGSWTQFHEHFLKARSQRRSFDRLCQAWEADGKAVYEALGNVRVHIIGEDDLGNRVRDRLATLVAGQASVAAAVLEKIVTDSPHLRLTAKDVWERLAAEGVRRKTQSSWPRAATGNQQNIQTANGPVFQVTGGRNVITLHNKPEDKRPFPRAVGMVIPLILVAVAVAGYFSFRGSASPAYFRTGPTAGIAVTTDRSECSAINQNGFLSPAKVVFGNVSLVRSLSIDGRSAFVMRGSYNESEYYWIVSDPDGNGGGMWLGWGPTASQRCELPIPGSPISAQQRQVASVAIPAVQDGRRLSFEAHLWYRTGKQIHPDIWTGN